MKSFSYSLRADTAKFLAELAAKQWVVAGLGERKVTIPNLDAGRDAFRLILHEAFPKLKDGGGFMFGKGKANSRYIEVLSPYCLTSPRILRDRVGSARTYIIPMQKDLSLSVSMNIEEEVS